MAADPARGGLGPKCAAVVSSNVAPTLWRIDPVSLAVTRHDLRGARAHADPFDTRHSACYAQEVDHDRLKTTTRRLVAETEKHLLEARRTLARAVDLVDQARNLVHARRLHRQVAEMLKKRVPPG